MMERKTILISVCMTLFVVSSFLNIGLISGWVRIASPEQHAQNSVTDYNKTLLKVISP